VSIDYTGPALVGVATATKLDDYHVHYFLDVDATPYLGSQVSVPTSDPRIIHTAATQVSFDNVGPGRHVVTVLLTGANHVSVNPPLSDQVTFTIT
jgi:hypothetical protein